VVLPREATLKEVSELVDGATTRQVLSGRVVGDGHRGLPGRPGFDGAPLIITGGPA
jgi:hypothetical protein